MKLDEYRKVIAFAIDCEAEARVFYQEAAKRCDNDYLKNMFLNFAAEEKTHKTILEDILSGSTMGFTISGVQDYNVSLTVDKPTLSTHMKPADAIALAMKNEEEAMNLYLSLAKDSTDPMQKKVFEDLAAMERGHKYKMEKAYVDIGFPEVW